jgi:hypothetical protein
MKCPCENCIALPMCITVKSNRLDILIDKCSLLSEWLFIKDTKLIYKKGKVYQIFINHKINSYDLTMRIHHLKQNIPHLDIKADS